MKAARKKNATSSSNEQPVTARRVVVVREGKMIRRGKTAAKKIPETVRFLLKKDSADRKVEFDECPA